MIIGSFLNVVVYRVPAGIPLTRPSQCPVCDAPVRPWQNVPLVSWLALRGKCASCGVRISARYPLVELATGVAFVGVTWWLVESFGSAALAQGSVPPEFWPVLVAYLYLASISIALTMIDLDTRRLPNVIVLPSYIVLAALFALACLLGVPWEALLRAAIGGLALFAFYFLLRVVKPGGMGGGDVKLAGVLGAALGWIGWGALVVGAFAAFLIGGVVGLALMATRKATRKSAIPFGPYMVAGAWVGVLSGEAIARWYVGMLVAG
nr:A24 family peptidase [Microbacterium invictum]